MKQDFEYRTRPGGLALSVTAFAGLCLLAAFMWHVVPGFVLLLLIPALGVVAYQLIVTPVYGLRVTQDSWVVYDGPEDRFFPTHEIAHLRVTDPDGEGRCTLVLTNGGEFDLPDLAVPSPLDLIEQATNRGIPVRQVA